MTRAVGAQGRLAAGIAKNARRKTWEKGVRPRALSSPRARAAARIRSRAQAHAMASTAIQGRSRLAYTYTRGSNYPSRPGPHTAPAH